MEYCPARQPNGSYNYLNCQTLRPYRAYTYLAYAEAVVEGWLQSASHRKSLLSTDYQYLGCAARISKNPYQHKQVPYARLAQSFGGYGTNDSTSQKVNKGGN